MYRTPVVWVIMSHLRCLLLFVVLFTGTQAVAQSRPKYTNIHDFGGTIVYSNGTSGPDGIESYAGATFDSAGNMYGTTVGGGAIIVNGLGGGMIWEVTTSGAYKDLHDFQGTATRANGTTGPDGIEPCAGVTIDSSGNLYGTASGGGEFGGGMVWEITASGTYLNLHDFGGTIVNADGTGGPDGTYPFAGVTIDRNGNLYGTTEYGGANKSDVGPSANSGMVWEITVSGKYRDLHDFGGYVINANGTVGKDGVFPASPVAFDSAGNRYGTAIARGPNTVGNDGSGMLWEITAAGTYKDIHDFGGTIVNASGAVGLDGLHPAGQLTFDGAGNMYGTAEGGGATDQYGNSFGMVWEVTASGSYVDLHDFGGAVVYPNGTIGVDGRAPAAGVTFDQAGNMFGTTYYGGAYGEGNNGFGMLWELTASGSYFDLHDFGGSATRSDGSSGYDGTFPCAPVTVSTAGVLFGVNENGGKNAAGWYGAGMMWSLAGVSTPAVKSVSLAPNSVVGGTSSTGTVTLGAAAATGGATVTLSSTNMSATVPKTVTIAAGATTATFAITTVGVDDSTTVTISAGSGLWAKTATLTITPAVLSSLSLNPKTVDGGDNSTGTVTLSGPAGPSGTWVELGDNSDYVAAPANVLVPAGANSATFTINTGVVSASTTVTLTATSHGVIKSADLIIAPPTLASISIDPTEVAGGNPATGTVTLSGEAGVGGMAVTLASNSSEVTVPKSVTVAAGQEEATFQITTITVAEKLEATITATNAKVSHTAELTVTPPTLEALSLNPTTLIGGSSSTGAVGLSGPAPTSGMTVKVSSNSHLGTVPATVKVKPGQRVATFTVKTVAIAAQETVTISASLNEDSETAQLKITPPALSSVTVKPTSLVGGISAVGTVTLNGSAPAGGISVGLSVAGPGAVPAYVIVPVNKTSATFSVKTVAVATNQIATLTASQGGVHKTATISVSAPTLKSVALSPASVAPGKTSKGTVTISSAAPTGGLVITLSSSLPAATPPTTVTIAAGKTSATFTVKTSTVSARTTVTILGALNGVTKTATLTIT